MPSLANVPEPAWNRRAILRNALLATWGWNGLTNLVRAGTDANPAEGMEIQFPAMGSLINVRWVTGETYSARDSKDLADVPSLKESLREIANFWNDILSDYDPDSESMQVATRADRLGWQTVSQELAETLDHCHRWHQLSQGAFDASVGSITTLRRRRKEISSSAWRDALECSGWEKLEWDSANRRVRFLRPGLRWDFGAIGKGIVADRIHHKLNELGITQCIVNFAGNMRVGAKPVTSAGWPISIDSLYRETSSAGQAESIELFRMRLEQAGIATSGDRWQKLPDAKSNSPTKRTSHILDPRTGLGIDVEENVTVVAETATDADAAATALCVQWARGDQVSGESLRERGVIRSYWIQTRKTTEENVTLRSSAPDRPLSP